jgi:hypothetical protein
MRALGFALSVVAASIAAGCIPSLHALYTDETTTFEPGLLGAWEQGKAESMWEFTQKGTNTYGLVYTDKQGKAGRFDVRLVAIGERHFLDLYPEDPKEVENPYYKFHLFRMHTFLKLSLDGSSLQLAGMNPTWLNEKLKADPSAIQHERVNNQVVITASPKELQAFVHRYADDKDAFSAVIKLTRIQAAEVAAVIE